MVDGTCRIDSQKPQTSLGALLAEWMMSFFLLNLKGPHSILFENLSQRNEIEKPSSLGEFRCLESPGRAPWIHREWLWQQRHLRAGAGLRARHASEPLAAAAPPSSVPFKYQRRSDLAKGATALVTHFCIFSCYYFNTVLKSSLLRSHILFCIC